MWLRRTGFASDAVTLRLKEKTGALVRKFDLVIALALENGEIIGHDVRILGVALWSAGNRDQFHQGRMPKFRFPKQLSRGFRSLGGAFRFDLPFDLAHGTLECRYAVGGGKGIGRSNRKSVRRGLAIQRELKMLGINRRYHDGRANQRYEVAFHADASA